MGWIEVTPFSRDALILTLNQQGAARSYLVASLEVDGTSKLSYSPLSTQKIRRGGDQRALDRVVLSAGSGAPSRAEVQESSDREDCYWSLGSNNAPRCTPKAKPAKP